MNRLETNTTGAVIRSAVLRQRIHLPAMQWQLASARADRVLVAVMAVIIAIGGIIFGSALVYSPAVVRTVRLMNTMVEYVQIPAPAAPVSASLDSGREAGEKLLAQHRCLAEAMYYEARGEGERGQEAVAEVILHRLQSGGYGRSICAVVYEGAPRAGCQFSFACDGSKAREKSREDWRNAQVLAARILAGEIPLSDITYDAMNYHADYVRPTWAAKLVRTAQIGNHIFYRRPDGPHFTPMMRPSED
ncbi:MAG TPA: cell wall hydrolase [Rhizomicrobium sp.]|nr:cell wall hydrolase [Rhizomicrobium sp.]